MDDYNPDKPKMGEDPAKTTPIPSDIHAIFSSTSNCDQIVNSEEEQAEKYMGP